MKECITDTQLQRLVAGTLSVTERKRVARHVQQCRKCSDRLQATHLLDVALKQAVKGRDGLLDIEIPRPSADEDRDLRDAVLRAFDRQRPPAVAAGLVADFIARLRKAFAPPAMPDVELLGYAATASEDQQSDEALARSLIEKFATRLEQLLATLLDESIPLSTRTQLLKRMERITREKESTPPRPVRARPRRRLRKHRR